jgi:hypothetical protein
VSEIGTGGLCEANAVQAGSIIVSHPHPLAVVLQAWNKEAGRANNPENEHRIGVTQGHHN